MNVLIVSTTLTNWQHIGFSDANTFLEELGCDDIHLEKHDLVNVSLKENLLQSMKGAMHILHYGTSDDGIGFGFLSKCTAWVSYKVFISGLREDFSGGYIQVKAPLSYNDAGLLELVIPNRKTQDNYTMPIPSGHLNQQSLHLTSVQLRQCHLICMELGDPQEDAHKFSFWCLQLPN